LAAFSLFFKTLPQLFYGLYKLFYSTCYQDYHQDLWRVPVNVLADLFYTQIASPTESFFHGHIFQPFSQRTF